MRVSESFVPASASALHDPWRKTKTRHAAVSLHGVTKRFPLRRTWRESLLAPLGRTPSITAVNQVTFDVEAGECFGVLGPNGAGKTTLFRMLAAAMPPDAGTIHVAGAELTREPPKQMRGLVGTVVANERTLYWRLSAAENLLLYASLHRLRGKVAKERIGESLQVVGLSDSRQRLVGEFSSGMRQRLLIARALLSRPPLLLLDEPTRSLDPIAAREFRQFVRKELIGTAGCTVLVATHNDDEAFGLCDRVAVLDRGRVLAVDTMHALRARVSSAVFDLTTTTPSHAVFEWLVQDARATSVELVGDEGEGWSRVRLTVPGDRNCAAEVLELVTAAGVRVGHFSQVPSTLADVIERVVSGAPSEEC